MSSEFSHGLEPCGAGRLLDYLHTMRSEPGWSHAGSRWYLLSTETSLTCNQPDLDFSVPCSIAFPLLEPKSIQLVFLSLVTES